MSARLVTCLAFAVLFVIALPVALGSGQESRALARQDSAVARLPASGQASSVSLGVSVPLTTTTPTATLSPTATATPCPMSFSDVHPSDYFYEAVRWLYCKGAISGYGDGTFRPGNNINRAQLTKILVLALDLVPYTPPTPTFCDVPVDHPFYVYIETYAHYFYVCGICGPDCTFRPYNNTTRGQLSKIMVLSVCLPLYTPSSATFRDVPTTHTFYMYIETAYHYGVISGYTCGTDCLEFRPESNVTRGQASKIIYRSVAQRFCTPTPYPTPPPPTVMPAAAP